MNEDFDIIDVFQKDNDQTKENYDTKKEAIEMIKNKTATCVVVKDNKIISAESTRGIGYILSLYENNQLEGAFIADTIIGKAAAMIFDLGKANGCYAETMSSHGLKWLNTHSIDASYNTLVPEIENRTKTGNCPMENTVKDLNDTKEAYIALKKKVEELKGANK